MGGNRSGDDPASRHGETVGTSAGSLGPSGDGALPPGMMVGEYRIEGVLGEGGMGRGYAATHPVIAKRAAIKVLHPELSRHAARTPHAPALRSQLTLSRSSPSRGRG